jgi:hypothetical protein
MGGRFANTRAYEHLRRWRDKSRRNTAGALARVCGVAAGTAANWFSGHMRPAEHLRGPVYVLTGALPRWWLTTAERQQQRAAMRRALAAASGARTRRQGGTTTPNRKDSP